MNIVTKAFLLPLLGSTVACMSTVDSGTDQRSACVELVDAASVADADELRLVAQNIADKGCDADQLVDDLADELRVVLSSEEVSEVDDRAEAIADTILILGADSTQDRWQFRSGCTNDEWVTAYINLREVFGFSSVEAHAIANAACMAK